MPNGTAFKPPNPQKDGKFPDASTVIAPGKNMVVDTETREVAAEPSSNNSEIEQREVIAGCQRGESDAYRALFESHKDKVYSIALRFAGDPAVAMDIAQDTFVKLMGRIQQYRWESSFDAWLYRLVVNSCMDYRRRQKRWLPLMEDVLNTFKTPKETALVDLLLDEKQQKIQDLVSGLVPEQKMVVVLRYTEDMSYEEIADVLGCSRGTVASRLNRAHKILERRLKHLAE
jgi:RNA polymerase sigma-70 factor (ECF subfamily)